ncbi:MAG: hypothetical protein ACUVWB_10565 [Anaerolineae bacterium]
MNRRCMYLIAGALTLVCLFAAGTVAWALADFDLNWHVIAGGGGQATSAGFRIAGTVGQPAVGAMSSAGFQLGSGFWFEGGAEPTLFKRYLPLILKKR